MAKRRVERASAGRAAGAVAAEDLSPTLVSGWALPAGIGLISVAVLSVYLRTVWFGWLQYDDILITDNPLLTGGFSLEGLRVALVEGMDQFWYPLTSMSFMLGYALTGAGAWGQHLMNVLLHLGTSVLLLVLLRRWTGNVWAGLAGALLFAAHPIGVESVAWVTGRKDVLCGLLWVATLLVYGRYARAFTPRWALAVFGCFLLGMASKVNMAALLPLLLVFDWQPLRRVVQSGRGGGIVVWLVMEKLPLAAMAVAAGGMTWRLQEAAQNIRSLEEVSLGVRVMNSVVVYAMYVVKLVWPVGLTVHYPYLEQGPPVGLLVGSVLMLAGVSVVCVWQWRRMPLLLVGWLWYVVALLPAVGLLRAPDFLTADRYLYVPMMGLVLMVSAVLARVLAWKPGWQAGVGVAVSGVVLALAVLSVAQTNHWRSDLDLWRHGHALYPDAPLMQNGVATALIQVEQLDEAEKILRGGRDKAGRYTFIFDMNLATIGLARSDWAGAFAEVRRVMEAAPEHRPAYVLLAAILEGVEAETADSTRKETLARERRQALLQAQILDGTAPLPTNGMAPDGELAGAYGFLAASFLKAGKPMEAQQLAQRAGFADPANPRYPNLLGRTHEATGSPENARKFYNIAIKLQANYIPALKDLAALDGKTGGTEAKAAFEQALRAYPGDEEVKRVYGELYGGR